MFGIIKEKDRIRKAESENKALKARNQELEEAILDLANKLSEVKHGETVPTENQ